MYRAIFTKIGPNYFDIGTIHIYNSIILPLHAPEKTPKDFLYYIYRGDDALEPAFEYFFCSISELLSFTKSQHVLIGREHGYNIGEFKRLRT